MRRPRLALRTLLLAAILTGCVRSDTHAAQLSEAVHSALPVQSPARSAPAGADADADGDRIPDDVDHCPNEQEDYDGFEDEDGCPEEGHFHPPVALRVVLYVEFARGSATLGTRAREAIDRIVETLAAHPEIQLVEAAGLADRNESQADTLSERRARAVVDALTAKGIANDRVRAKGYGARCPNLTLAAWNDPGAQRIVRFVVLKTADGQDPETVACDGGNSN